MDILTQGLLGAALAQTCAKKHEIRVSALAGFASGLLADADILIRSSSDPLLTIEYHRHFTHSILFIPFGALLAALLLWPFIRRHLSFRRLYVFAFLGYSLSGVLDAFTSYGTQLFWPLVDERIALNIISIVDPVFTLVLLAGVVLSIKRKAATAARMGLLFAGVYMLVGWIQHERAWTTLQEVATDRGHVIERGIVKPTLANILVWRTVYQYKGRLYVDGVRAGLFDEPKFYSGQSVRLFRLDQDFQDIPRGLPLYKDIERFVEFSDGYVSIDPETSHILGDIRYSSKPLGIKPMWGIEMNLDNPQHHAEYRIYRNLSKENRQQYFDMLLGKDLVGK